MSDMIKGIALNTHIHVSDLHIRYEDALSNPVTDTHGAAFVCPVLPLRRQWLRHLAPCCRCEDSG